jgi:hypothetical protein
VANYLVSQLAGTVGEHWIKDYIENGDGRGMLKALDQHFMSKGHISATLRKARATRLKAEFKNQHTYSWEKFTADLKEVYDTHEDLAQHPISEEDKMNDLKDKIKTANVEFNSVAQSTLASPQNQNFLIAIGEVGALVSSYFPAKSYDSSGRIRVASLAASFADDTRDGKFYHNGVDITDLTRMYSDGDWEKLSSEVRGAIVDAKAKKKQNSNGGNNKKKRSRSADKKKAKKIKKMQVEIKALKKKIKTQGAEDEEESSDEEDAIGPAAFNKKSKKETSKKNKKKGT